MNFMTGRGCPYNCTYCFNHILKKMSPKGGYLRNHSVDYVINEILDAKKKFDFKFIKFVDDLFILKKMEWLEEFSERYRKEIGLPFYIHSRFDFMKPEIADLLKKAGCKVVQMSIESTNSNIRKKVLNRGMEEEKIISGAKYCGEKGIAVLTYTMLGLPTSTINDDIDAVNFNLMLRKKYNKGILPEFPIFQPYPKTELGDVCIKNGWFDGDMSKIVMYGTLYPSVLSCFTKKEKNIQMNISLLGQTAVEYPFFRGLIMNYLIYLPTNRLFKKICAIGRLINYPSKVYKRRYTLKERYSLFKKGLGMEKIRRNQK